MTRGEIRVALDGAQGYPMNRNVGRLGSIVGAAGVVVALGIVVAAAPCGGEQPARAPDTQVGQAFRVPYRLTDTNHFLVRVRINGKGPFNFLVDSGAPALIIATETASKAGLKPRPGEFWTPVDRLDLEGGARLGGLKARVDDPYQLVGINALGLAGASIDGILGFTILARFRLEIDLTQDRMTWTRLDHEPRDPPVPRSKPGEPAGAPSAVQAMNALGPLAKGLALFLGRQPEEEQHPRGFLGLEWSENTSAGRKRIEVKSVLDDSPAARAGIDPADRILRIKGHDVANVKDVLAAIAKVQSGEVVPIIVQRGSDETGRELRLTPTAGKGL
jgi:hypothetical protein